MAYISVIWHIVHHFTTAYTTLKLTKSIVKYNITIIIARVFLLKRLFDLHLKHFIEISFHFCKIFILQISLIEIKIIQFDFIGSK